MFSTINNIGKKIKNGVSNGKVALAAAVVATGIVGSACNTASAAIADVSAIQTQFTSGPLTTVTNVTGGGTAETGFISTNHYTINYHGGNLAVTQIQTSAGTYVPTAQGVATVRRNTSSPNTDILWYATTGNINTADGSTLDLKGPQVAGYNQAFSSNNLLVGADNLFANTGNTAANNNTNVERIDLIYSNGIQASSDKIFTLFDRGLKGQHDAFKIAAVTSIDAQGKPTGYGPLVTVNKGSYGNTDLIAEEGYTVLRTNNTIVGDTFHPSDKVIQTIGAVAIPITDLQVASGSTVFGYSIFGPDVSDGGNTANLVDWTNTTFFHTNTNSITTGGIDPIAVSGVLYSSIPEPSTAALAMVGAGALLTRRGKRRPA